MFGMQVPPFLDFKRSFLVPPFLYILLTLALSAPTSCRIGLKKGSYWTKITQETFFYKRNKNFFLKHFDQEIHAFRKILGQKWFKIN